MAVARRWVVFAISAIPTIYCAWLFVLLARFDGWSPLDNVRLVLSTLCVFWLCWGAASGLLGFFAQHRPERAVVRPEREAHRDPHADLQ